ncbi:hypothetical protein MMC30_001078 [Trapelia coarctata]|nr:hypothetical protein [Trapelia coarctata]
MGKFGYYMPWYLVGSALVAVDAALMRTVRLDASPSLIYGYCVILAAGVGCYVQASFPVAQAKVAQNQIPAAVALIGCAQLSGLAISFAVAYAIFLNTVTSRIESLRPGTPRGAVQAAIIGVGAQIFSSLSDELRTRVLQSVSASIADVYDQVLATGALLLAMSLLMRRERLFLQP